MKSTLNELESILKTVELYQDGHNDLDIEKLKKAFHPNAHVIGYYEGELMYADRSQYLDILAADEDSAESEKPGYTKILSLDKTDTTVVVKVESLMAGVRYISQLAMLNVDGKWQIVNGLFHSEK
ncbi:MAG: nuclear transport factor 2 family protein [Desulfobacterales bacterium]|nr:nuclear transport factor 2 family protein [Desulfobacterales bacterium]